MDSQQTQQTNESKKNEQKSALNKDKNAATAAKPALMDGASRAAISNTTTKNKSKNNSARKITRKMGPQKGARYKKAVDRATWYRACHAFKTHPACRKMTNAQFLRSSYCPKVIGGYTHSTRRAFAKKLQEYEQKTLTPSDVGRKRVKPAQYPYLEEKLIAFIRMRRQEQAGVNWNGMKQKVREWIEELQDPKERQNYDKFQISDGWISNVLKRHKIMLDQGRGNHTAAYLMGGDDDDDDDDDEYGDYSEQAQAKLVDAKMTILKSYNEIKKSNPEWDGDIIVQLFPEMKPFVEAEKKVSAKKSNAVL